MVDIGKILLARIDTIIENWIDMIRDDIDIASSKGLAYESVRNSIPLVIDATATLLSTAVQDRTQKLNDYSWEHGVVRAEQGYNVAEIVREYSLLRKIIFTVLTPELQLSSGTEILAAAESIDSVIDRVVTLSLESYVMAQLTELKRIRAQLLLSNQELTRLIAMQKEEISHLAHELKSPLNSIMGFSSLLLQQQKVARGDSALNLQLTEKVITNSQQLLRLINDVLEISRYDRDNVPLALESCDVQSLISDIVETLSIAAEQKDLSLIYDGDRAPEQILTDPVKLRQIVINLISNAIRYTELGTVNVTCLKTPNEQWCLIVADTGIGIEPAAQARIFEPYFRVIARSDSAADGTGLGLAIVNKLVRLLQGTITLDSKLGVGSTFTVTLPIAIAGDRNVAD